MGRDTLKVGDIFEITNPDRPEGIAGKWEIVATHTGGYKCKRPKEEKKMVDTLTFKPDPWMKGRNLIVDPPSGWMYGFPKPFVLAEVTTTMNDWLLANGYPQSEIDQWEGREVPCRFWEDRRP